MSDRGLAVATEDGEPVSGDVVNELARALAVSGLALLGADRHVLAVGLLSGSDVGLAELASSARQLFRQTQPPLDWLALEFMSGHVAVMPVGDCLLVLQSDVALVADHVVAQVTPRLIALTTAATNHTVSGAPPPAIVQHVASPELMAQHALEVLNRVARAARAGLGGPVVRNYLRKTRTALAEPSLEIYQVDLEGVVTHDGAQPFATCAALGAWAQATRTRASVVITDLARVSLRELAGDLAGNLDGSGFFSDEP
jgi:hypothetical protein